MLMIIICKDLCENKQEHFNENILQMRLLQQLRGGNESMNALTISFFLHFAVFLVVML